MEALSPKVMGRQGVSPSRASRAAQGTAALLPQSAEPSAVREFGDQLIADIDLLLADDRRSRQTRWTAGHATALGTVRDLINAKLWNVA